MTEKVEHTELPFRVYHARVPAMQPGHVCDVVKICADVPYKNLDHRIIAEVLGENALGDANMLVLACNSYPALLAERDRLREALKRLGSMEAFDIARAVDKSRDQELLARIDYARAAIKDTNQ